MAVCFKCKADVGFVYDGDDLLTIDLAPVEGGNVRLDGGGKISGHRVSPGSGTHRLHRCEDHREEAA